MAPSALDFDQWNDALYFATQYHLPKAREYIIDTIGSSGCLPQDAPAKVIQVADRSKINAPWLLPQYVALCERTNPLSDKEAELLTIQAFAAISRIREKRAALEGQKKGGEESRTACCCGTDRSYYDSYYGSRQISACECGNYTAPAMSPTVDMINDEPYLAARIA